MISCEQATRLLSEAQDRPLRLGEKISLKMHTAICSACRRFGLQLQSLRDFSRGFMRPDDRADD